MNLSEHSRNGDSSFSESKNSPPTTSLDPDKDFAPISGGAQEPPPDEPDDVVMPIPGASYSPISGGAQEPPPEDPDGVVMPVPGRSDLDD